MGDIAFGEWRAQATALTWPGARPQAASCPQLRRLPHIHSRAFARNAATALGIAVGYPYPRRWRQVSQRRARGRRSFSPCARPLLFSCC